MGECPTCLRNHQWSHVKSSTGDCFTICTDPWHGTQFNVQELNDTIMARWFLNGRFGRR